MVWLAKALKELCPEQPTQRELGDILAVDEAEMENRTMKPIGGAYVPRQRGREQECCFILRDCQEPPGVDPHDRWCGGRELITPGDPIVAAQIPIRLIIAYPAVWNIPALPAQHGRIGVRLLHWTGAMQLNQPKFQ